MQNLNLWNAAMGKSICDINTDEEVSQELDKLLDLPIEEAFNTLMEMLPPAIRKLKFSTFIDIYVNLNECTVEELEKYFEEEDEPE